MNPKPSELRTIIKANHAERALARVALAWHQGRGIRLSGKDVDDIIQMDDALHTRLWNAVTELQGEMKEHQ